MTIPMIFVIAGVALVTVAIVGGGLEIKDLKVPTLPPRGRILSAVTGVAFTVLGLLLLIRPPETDKSIGLTPSPPPQAKSPAPTPQVKIDTPPEGAEVQRKIVVAGTASPPVPTSGSYWIVLRRRRGFLSRAENLSAAGRAVGGVSRAWPSVERKNCDDAPRVR